jgi:hypothetical protein
MLESESLSFVEQRERERSNVEFPSVALDFCCFSAGVGVEDAELTKMMNDLHMLKIRRERGSCSSP